MSAQERPEYEAACNAIADLYARGGGIVAIDGRPGSGKSKLATYLASRFEMENIKTDEFVIEARGRLKYRLADIAHIIGECRRRSRSIILDGAISQKTLVDLGYAPDVVIRVIANYAPESDEPLQKQVLDYERRYPRADIRLYPLPPPNEHAHGLRITSREWGDVFHIVSSEPEIIRAWIFGSRVTGVRTPKVTQEALDIDIAIQPSWPLGDAEGIDIRRGADFKGRHIEMLNRWNIQIQWHGSGAESDAWHLLGKQIWPAD